MYTITYKDGLNEANPSFPYFVGCASLPTIDKTDYYAKFTDNIFKYGGFAYA